LVLGWIALQLLALHLQGGVAHADPVDLSPEAIAARQAIYFREQQIAFFR
jgi:hypothetical protein